MIPSLVSELKTQFWLITFSNFREAESLLLVGVELLLVEVSLETGEVTVSTRLQATRKKVSRNSEFPASRMDFNLIITASGGITGAVPCYLHLS